MSALSEILKFLGKRYVWFTLVALALIMGGWITVADAKDLTSQVISAVKDWKPLEGVP